jgi:hypothetical protein
VCRLVGIRHEVYCVAGGAKKEDLVDRVIGACRKCPEDICEIGQEMLRRI